MERLSVAATAALADAFALGRPTEQAALADAGEQGRIWRVTTSHGTWAIKQALAHTEESRAAADIAFQEAAAAAGVPSPRPVRTREGRALLDGTALPDGGLPGAFRAFAWVDLVPDAPASAEDFGRIAAALHRLDIPATPDAEPWWGPAVSPAEWEGIQAAGRAAGEPWAASLEAALPDVLALGSLISDDDPADLRTCHRDLSVLNVRRTRDGGLTVLDWENCGPAVPVRELAVLLVVLTLQGRPDDAVAAYRAYISADGPARVRSPSDFSSAARGVHGLARLYALQSLDATRPEETRAFARERIGWVLSNPMSPMVSALLGRLSSIA